MHYKRKSELQAEFITIRVCEPGLCRISEYKQFFIHTPVGDVISCVGGNLLAITVFTSYNQIFMHAKIVNAKAVS